MATNRRKIMRNRRKTDLSDAMEKYFLYGNYPRDDSKARWMLHTKDRLMELWEAHREALLAEWISENPCTRPHFWWKHDAPAELVPGCDGSEFFAHQAHRRRIGGTGTPAYEVLALVPCFVCGLPESWLDEWPGNPGRGELVDPADPPTFESQAVYLDRHGLLTTDEKRHLKKHPELLKPEAVVFEEEDSEEDESAACAPA